MFSLPLIAAETDYNPQLNLGGRFGDADKGFKGQAGILIPIKQYNDSLFYTDLRGMFTENEVSEINLGLGYKRLLEDKNMVVGGYLFRDRRHEYGNNWGQWTVGGELLTNDFDLRVNGYFPTKDKVLAQSMPDDEPFVVGNSVVYQEAQTSTYYQTMNGYDIEVGKTFTKELPVDLGLYLRYFRFSGDNMDNLIGKGLRVNTGFDLADNVEMKVGLDWQDDNYRGSSLEATMGFSIPLGKDREDKKSEDPLLKRMVEPAKRDIDIIVGETTPKREVIKQGEAVDSKTGNTVDAIWFVTANGEGDGSRENPTKFSSLGELGAKENDIIVVLGDDGPINTGDSGFELLDGQKLLTPGGYILNEL